MRQQRSASGVLPVVAMLGTVICLWLAGRFVLQPAMDWLRPRVPMEWRVAWGLAVLLAAVLLSLGCMGLAYPPHDDEED